MLKAPAAASIKPCLLIVDDDALILDSLSYILEDAFDVRTANSRLSAMALLRDAKFEPQLALIDLGLPPLPDQPTEGFKLVGDLLAFSPLIRILVLSGQNEESNGRRARALGAQALVPKPCSPQQLLELLNQQLLSNRGAVSEHDDATGSLIGESLPMRKLKAQIDLYASSTFPALIEGASGSGKERVAEALHQLSPRATLPFIALNCAAISPNLVEATLFGHAKGAFTGAASAKAGYFEDAGEGTLFLDEIGELPLDLQPKLLRVLENGAFQRVGETTTRSSLARIVAATNRDLRAEVKAGRFRADLFHRLSVFSIAVPSVKDCGDDKLRLMAHFCQHYAKQHGTEAFTLDASAKKTWLEYHFPGNVRELKNIVIRLLAKHAGYTVTATDLIEEFDSSALVDDPTNVFNPLEDITNSALFRLDSKLAELELKYIDAAITLAVGNMSQAARILGLSRSTLYSRLDALRPTNTKNNAEANVNASEKPNESLASKLI